MDRTDQTGDAASLRRRIHRFAKEKALRGESILDLSNWGGARLWWFCSHDFEQTLRGQNSRTESIVDGREPLYSMFSLYELLAAGYCKVRARRFRERVREKKGPRVLFTSQTGQWRSSGAGERGTAEMDAFFAPVIAGLRELLGPELFSTYPLNGGPHPWFHAWKGILALRRRGPGDTNSPHLPLEGFLKGSTRAARVAARRRFAATWSRLEGSSEFIALARANGLDPSICAAKTGYYFRSVFPRVAELIDMGENLVRAVAPDAMMLLNETGIFERALVIAARRARVPTLAVQHGIITESDSAYMFEADEIAVPIGSDISNPPLPDVTAVYGEHDLGTLTKLSSYPAEAVVVTGQPRYDRLASILKGPSPEQMRALLQLPVEGKIVLWLTQSHALGAAELERTADEVFSAAAALEGAAVIVKQHPAETMAHTAALQSANLARSGRAIIIDRRLDTLEVIRASDVVITKHSTSGVEAAALDKPLIVLNLGGAPDVAGYVREGIAVGVYTQGELAPAIRRLLRGEDPTTASRPAYVKRHLHAIDGLAGRRVAEVVARMINRKDASARSGNE
jgi:hypothetical protein